MPTPTELFSAAHALASMHAFASPHMPRLRAALAVLCPGGPVAVAVDAAGDPAADLRAAHTLLLSRAAKMGACGTAAAWRALLDAGDALEAMLADVATPCLDAALADTHERDDRWRKAVHAAGFRAVVA
jgi:hypothetical protein